MKRIDSIIIRGITATLLIIISWTTSAQIKIVGQNAEKPDTGLDYLDKPLCFDKYMKGSDGSEAWFKGFYPKGEKVYVCGHLFYSIYFEGSKLVYGIEDGYYTLTGIIFTDEELKEVRDRVDKSLQRHNYKFLPGFAVNIERELYPPYSLGSESRLLEMLYRGNERSIHNELYERRLYGYGQNFCDAATYILTDEKGVEHYLWIGKEWWHTHTILMVDFVEQLTAEYVGKNVWIDYNRDEYSRMKHNLDLFDSKSLVYSDGALNIGEKKSYKCTDIVFDPKIPSVLAIVEDSSIRIAIPIEHISKSEYEIDSDLGKITATCTHAEHLFNEDDINEVLTQVSTSYALIKEENDRRLAEQQAVMAGRERQELLRKAEEKRLAEQWEREKAERERKIIAKYGEEYGNMVLNHKVAIGMTEEMCREALGYPSHTYESTTRQGNYLVLCYFSTRLHFTNGKLVRIEKVQ